MKAGLGSTRYTKQDYDQLKASALERKISGNRSLLKMNKLKSFSKVYIFYITSPLFICSLYNV